jgi:hypothetical protein
MVWVNPPNRVNYTVITHIRNVHSRKLSEFDATVCKMFNRDVDPLLRKGNFSEIARV